MLPLILALSSVAPSGADQCPAIADPEHEIAAGTWTLTIEEASYVISRPRAEDLLLAEWERDQAIAALEAGTDAGTTLGEAVPWLIAGAVALAAVGFTAGALGVYEITRPR